MRLLEATSLRLFDFTPDKIPPYAILSHTWDEGEVLFEDIGKENVSRKSGYKKIQYTAQQALCDGLEYIWVDTCCINKESSAELSESINSMFRWYQDSRICYAYLADTDEGPSQIASCRWFTRGFTLQELIAPGNMVFFSRNWDRLGSKMDLCDTISQITGIGVEYLCHYRELECASVAQRMSWAANRQTSRPEDISYSLLGIFGVNMPLLYGEGARAFIRLEEEIMRNSDDQSLFAWCDPDADPDALYGLLATSPKQFSHAKTMLSYESWESRPPYAMTNRGLRIELPVKPDQEHPSLDVAALNCPIPDDPNDDTFIGVNIQKLSSGGEQYARTRANRICHLTRDRGPVRTIYVPQPTAGPSKVFGGGGIFPHHIVVLGTGPDKETQYHMTSRLPPPRTTTKKFSTGRPEIHYSGKDPKFLIDARAAAHHWVPSHCRTTFSIPRAKKQLAGAFFMKNKSTENQICIMFGSMTDYNIGFSAIDTETSDSIIPETSVTLSELQPLFSPTPPGRWIRLEHVSVRIDTEVHVFYGGKYFVLRCELAGKDQENQNGNDEDSASLPLSRGETYISPAVHPPSPVPRVIAPSTQPRGVHPPPKKPQKDRSKKTEKVVTGAIGSISAAAMIETMVNGLG